MSIPGLGQIAPQQVTTSTTRTITLRPFWEWRFEVPRSSTTSSSLLSAPTNPSAATTSTAATTPSSGGGTTVRLTSGQAERDGTDLAPNHVYTFPRNTKSKILTYTGATLEVAGECTDEVARCDAPEQSPQLMVLNLHFALQELRAAAAAAGAAGAGGNNNRVGGGGNSHGGGGGGGAGRVPGPRVMVCGEKDTGKTSVARTLAALATRVGAQPLVASVDPSEGMLALPGTVSAAVFGTVMDAEDPAGGFGVSGTPSSGPSAVPVKLPMVYYFGREKPEEDVPLWKDLVGKLGSSVRAKFAGDEVVRQAGLVLDTPAATIAKADVDVLVHAATEFAVNIVVVLGSPGLHAELQRRLVSERTAHGEAITVIPFDKSDGVAPRDRDFLKFTREAAIKEYFFGDAKRTLSPFTQSVGFDDVAIFKAPDDSDFYDNPPALEPVDISGELSHWTLAVMNASVNDPPETIRQAPVMGFVAVADVDEDRRRLKILSPVSGRLGNRPMIWGRWPEPYINLLG